MNLTPGTIIGGVLLAGITLIAGIGALALQRPEAWGLLGQIAVSAAKMVVP